MPRPIRIALIVTLLAGPSIGPARGQDVIRGKSMTKDSKPAAGESKGKGAGPQATEVVRPARSVPVKVWEVDQEGSAYERDTQVVIGVESVILYSDGRMRWWYYLHNKSDKNYAPNFVGAKMYVADERGETYRPTGWQHRPDGEGCFKIPSQGGTRERFWVDYPAPRKEADTFKMGIPVSDFFWAGILFKPFSVKLVEPISASAGEPKAEEAKPEEEASAVDKAKPKPAPPKPAGNSNEALAQALREIPEKGLRYEGNIRPKAGPPLNGGILFDKGPARGPISARLYRKPGNPAGVKLLGTIVEDVTLADGVAIQLRDFDDVVYTFALEGKMFTGTDTAGNRYVFSLKP